ncbi:MAG: inositol monophosphatase family protein [Atribacterota bacterium]|nr:inositol monophosphatase family protein [Atribacterota bacterium]MDD4896366.1 inositol monophosphatase family protein [Atribacterota bacterium]MDD5637099.1 inositol monophosphatase family protein [Atribacterota bacterium]
MKYDILESIISVSLKAGNFIRHYYESREFRVSEKKDCHDLVTNVDRESQEIITTELSNRFPDIPVIGEEDKDILKKEHAFFIDPLDGTLNFVKQVPFFTVSVGYWRENKPVCGVVFDPLRQDLFYARKGAGSYRNGRQIKTTDSNNGKYQLFASDWGHEPYYYNKNILMTQRLLKENSYLFRFMGCASLAICYVGAGVLDGYWHYKLAPWDMAAGVLIAEEAGASVTLINGKPFDLWQKDILVVVPNLKNKVIPIFNSI